MGKEYMQSEIKRLCAEYGGQTAFAKQFGIPLRTVQDWHRGKSTPLAWVFCLLLFAANNGYKKEQ